MGSLDSRRFSEFNSLSKKKLSIKEVENEFAIDQPKLTTREYVHEEFFN